MARIKRTISGGGPILGTDIVIPNNSATANYDTTPNRSKVSPRGRKKTTHRKAPHRNHGRRLRLPSPLRAPQPLTLSSVLPAPRLGAPQPDDSSLPPPLGAPQPFSNAPEADHDITERSFVRTTNANNRRVTSRSSTTNRRLNTNRINASKYNGNRKTHHNTHHRSNHRKHGSGKRRLNSGSNHQHIHRNNPHEVSGTSHHSRGSGSGSTEPENDTGAQPLLGNVVRKPSFTVSRAEAAKAPLAAVGAFRVDSISTAQTSDTTKLEAQNSPLSLKAASSHRSDHHHNHNHSHGHLDHSRSNHETGSKRRYPNVSRSMRHSFTGEVISSSSFRKNNFEPPPPLDDTERAQARISNASSSIELELSKGETSTSIIADGSIVAEVVDEAQLEREFEERMKSRMVQAVEIRRADTQEEKEEEHDEENPGSKKSRSSSSGSDSSSQEESQSTSRHVSFKGEISSVRIPAKAPRLKSMPVPPIPIPREATIQDQNRKRTTRCIIAWACFFFWFAVLMAVLVVFLKFWGNNNGIDPAWLEQGNQSAFATPSDPNLV